MKQTAMKSDRISSLRTRGSKESSHDDDDVIMMDDDQDGELTLQNGENEKGEGDGSEPVSQSNDRSSRVTP